MRLIDADTLVHAIVDTPTETSGYNPVYLCGSATRQNEIVDIIQELPTVDPVVHGRWEHLGGDEWCCTTCGNVLTTEGSWERPTKKYCDECGAKMDKED